MFYVYESHLGGYFITESELTFDEKYCDSCGDSDWFLGEFPTLEEAENFINEHEKEYWEETE